MALGGIRSGKSHWAEAAIAEALPPGQPVRYLATGATTNDDPGWSQRVGEHRRRRPPHWSTRETVDIAKHLRCSPDTATLVDDVGGWLTAMLDRRGGWRNGSVTADVDELLDAVAGFNAPLMLVSPEVGLTVVPATAAGRRFADELGTLNQRLADLCQRVVLIVAGHPLSIKAGLP